MISEEELFLYDQCTFLTSTFYFYLLKLYAILVAWTNMKKYWLNLNDIFIFNSTKTITETTVGKI